MYDMDEDEDDHEHVEYRHPVRRFRLLDAVIMAIGLPREVFGALAQWCQDVIELVVAHENWKVQQEQSPIKVAA